MENNKASEFLHKFGEQEITKLYYNLLNMNKKDVEIINRLNSDNPELNQSFKLKSISSQLQEMFNTIRNHSLKAHTMHAFVKSGDATDTLVVDTTFNYRRMYLSPFSLNYLVKPNSFAIKGNYILKNNRLYVNRKQNETNNNDQTEKNPFLLENELSAGVETLENNIKRSLFVQNTAFLKNNYESVLKYKLSRVYSDIKRKETNSSLKVILRKNLNEKPYIFREKYLFDDINRINLEIGHRVVKNYLDETQCSPFLKSNVPHQDSQYFAKIGYENGFADVYHKNIYNLNIYSKLCQSINGTSLQNKIFFRKFFFIDSLSLILQSNIEFNSKIPLDSDHLKVHEKLFVHNFKGVNLPSRKQVQDQGISSYILNFNKNRQIWGLAWVRQLP